MPGMHVTGLIITKT